MTKLKKGQKVKLNPNLEKFLKKQKDLNLSSAYLGLLAIYFDLEKSLIPKEVAIKLDELGVISLTSGESPKLLAAIFDEETVEDPNSPKWKWVEEYRDFFKKANRKRASTNGSCKAKMIKFFQANPEVRKEDVMKAVEKYVDSVNDVQYIMSANYFISKRQPDGTYASKLEEFLEVTKDETSNSRPGYGKDNVL